MRLFRFSLLTLLLLMTFASLSAGWISYKLESQRLAAREGCRKQLVSRLEWMEEDRCRLYAELETLSEHPLSGTPFKAAHSARESKETELYKLTAYMDALRKELDDLR